jgi:ribosome-interacting GTPase 1
MARTQKNKATNYHLGTLKAKLAKLRNELLIEQGGGGGGGGCKLDMTCFFFFDAMIPHRIFL